tara:strand:- start:267 stop:659 length:393 start_codon:yes stop_codon:yes gene_type:complete
MIFLKNISLGKVNFLFIILLILTSKAYASESPQGNFTGLKVLDKISSKNISLTLENGKEIIFEDLSIKSIKCKNSEFDDNPEVTAYIQVRDLNNKTNNEVFVFNGWMFSSSPSINPFDHPVYDIWLINCN